MPTAADRAKRVLDVVGSALGLCATAPLLPVVWLLVRVDSRGPFLHRSRRIGRGARPFTLWKVRTMEPAAAACGPAVTAGDDARVTRVGRVLRRLHVDEVPQLVNVLRGEMSLVGPRPEAPEYVDADDPRWQLVLAVAPGLTGPTQLRFAPVERRLLRERDADAVYRTRILPAKLESDVAYVRGRSFARDLRWLARTLLP